MLSFISILCAFFGPHCSQADEVGRTGNHSTFQQCFPCHGCWSLGGHLSVFHSDRTAPANDRVCATILWMGKSIKLSSFCFQRVGQGEACLERCHEVMGWISAQARCLPAPAAPLEGWEEAAEHAFTFPLQHLRNCEACQFAHRMVLRIGYLPC